MTPIRFEVPLRTASTANLREHWAQKASRVKRQRDATRRRCPEWKAGPLLVVVLTRVAPRRLDSDNLQGALKSVRDAVASWLRVDDASPLVQWVYGQAKGPEPLVRVDVGPATPDPPEKISDLWLRREEDSMRRERLAFTTLDVRPAGAGPTGINLERLAPAYVPPRRKP